MQDLKEIDRQLAELAKVRFRYNIINPQNRKEEFEKFIAAKGKYNPQFTYKTVDVTETITALRALKINTTSPLGKILNEVREDLLEEAEALEAVGTDNFLVTKMFGSLSEEELSQVKQVLNNPEEESNRETTKQKTFPASELGKRIKEKLNHYNLPGWIITYSDTALSRTAITKDKKTITIKADEEFTEKDIQKLLVHEIETHVLRWYNGTQQPYNIFAIGTRDYLATEEGLAGYNEESREVAITNQQFASAIQALATHLGKTKGFAEIYQTIRPYVGNDEIAFQMVTRVKRGLGDTSKPGGYLKDHAYFRGYLQIKKFIEQGGNIKDLYIGKISINNLHLITEDALKKPTLLPEFLQ